MAFVQQPHYMQGIGSLGVDGMDENQDESGMEGMKSAPAPDIPVEGHELGPLVEVSMELQNAPCTVHAALARPTILWQTQRCFT